MNRRFIFRMRPTICRRAKRGGNTRTAFPSVRNLFIRTLSTFWLQYILWVFMIVPCMIAEEMFPHFKFVDVEGAYYAVSTMH